MSRIVASSLLASILASVSASTLAAESPSWDYMSLEWVANGEVENGSAIDVEGYRFGAAKSLTDNIFVRAESNEHYAKDGDAHIDIATGQMGVGGHYAIPSGPATLDLWGAANYQRVALADIVATGSSIDIGVKALFTNTFEIGVTGKVYGNVDFKILDDKADYTGYTINAAYFVTPEFAIQGSLDNYKLKFDNSSIGELKYKNIFGIGVKFTY